MSDQELSGRHFDRYIIEALLGEGTLTSVYRALEPSADYRTVALKLYPHELLTEANFRARFEQELRGIARVAHPHLLPILRAGHAEGIPYLVMPYCERGSLAMWLADAAPLSVDEALPVLEQAASALDALHQRGLLHLNLTASNILFDHDGIAYLSDVHLDSVRDAAGAVSGVTPTPPPATISPEVARGDPAPSAASDVYSLGVIAFQMLSGELPFQAASPVQQIMQHINSPVPSLRERRPSIAPPIAAAIGRALRKNPEERPARASDMLADISRGAGRELSPGGSPLRAAQKPVEDLTDVSADVALPGDSRPGVQPRSLPGEGMRSRISAAEDGFRFRRDLPDSASSVIRREKQRAERQYLRDRRARERQVRREVSGGPPWRIIGAVVGVLLVAGVAALFATGSVEVSLGGDPGPSLTQTADARLAATAAAGEQATQTLEAFAASLATQTQAAVLSARTATASAPTATPTPTSTPTVTPSPTATAFAGGQGLIAYVAERDNDADIFVIDPATSVETRITDNTGTDGAPSWSPDGQYLAFHSDAGGGRHIFVVSITCLQQPDSCPESLRQLTSGDTFNQYPEWAPSGRQLVYIARDGRDTLFRSVSLDGGVRDVTAAESGTRLLSYRSDGETLLFAGPGTGGFEIFQMPVTGTLDDAEELTNGNNSIRFLDVSPGGEEAVYTQDVGVRSQVFIAESRCRPVEDCVIRQLVNDRSTYLTPRYSPDNTMLLVAANLSGNFDLYALGFDGSVIRRITDQPYDEYDAVWQP